MKLTNNEPFDIKLKKHKKNYKIIVVFMNEKCSISTKFECQNCSVLYFYTKNVFKINVL